VGILICPIGGDVNLLELISSDSKAVDASFSIGITCPRSSDLEFGLDVVISWVGRSYNLS